MSDVKILRLSTGEDVIAKIVTETPDTITLSKAFVIIPRQSGPGQPVQLMMSLYMPYSDDDTFLINQDKVVTMVPPKKEILASYQQNTSSIFTPKSELITETITTGMQPDLNWIKRRNQVDNHWWTDSVRGATKYIGSNRTNAEATETTAVTGITSTGFTLGADTNQGEVNANTYTYCSWNWKANGQGSSNTDGSINTTYTSANTTAGFSICSYTGTGSNATIGHGLGVAPQVVLIKELNGTNNWLMSHQPLSASLGDYSRFITLNSTGAVSGAGNVVFQNSAFTSSVFNVGTSAGSNGSGQNYIAYCFAEKTGYSKFGSYTGNGNANGVFVYTGFKPALVMCKRTDGGTQNWCIMDNKRGYNPDVQQLHPNANNAESLGSGDTLDLLSNGFKMRATDGDKNGNGETFIYMAFGQSLVGSNNVPCTAR